MEDVVCSTEGRKLVAKFAAIKASCIKEGAYFEFDVINV